MLPRMRGEALTQWREFIVAGAECEAPLKLILKIAMSVPASAMPQWKPPWPDLLKAAASDQGRDPFHAAARCDCGRGSSVR
jgi:hypothetical protein